MNNKKDILKSIIAGDALGSVFHGLSEGHIRANFAVDEIIVTVLERLRTNKENSGFVFNQHIERINVDDCTLNP